MCVSERERVIRSRESARARVCVKTRVSACVHVCECVRKRHRKRETRQKEIAANLAGKRKWRKESVSVGEDRLEPKAGNGEGEKRECGICVCV